MIAERTFLCVAPFTSAFAPVAHSAPASLCASPRRADDEDSTPASLVQASPCASPRGEATEDVAPSAPASAPAEGAPATRARVRGADAGASGHHSAAPAAVCDPDPPTPSLAASLCCDRTPDASPVAGDPDAPAAALPGVTPCPWPCFAALQPQSPAMCIPTDAAVQWLIANAMEANQHIAELARRVAILENENRELRSSLVAARASPPPSQSPGSATQAADPGVPSAPAPAAAPAAAAASASPALFSSDRPDDGLAAALAAGAQGVAHVFLSPRPPPCSFAQFRSVCSVACAPHP